jgi:hypothetical protein
MPVGHTYSPIFRITPWAGAITTLNVAAYQWLRLCQPSYVPILLEKETVNRQIRTSRYGYRCTVTLEFMFPTPSSNETTLAQQILTAFADDRTVLELSLDGGTTYRVVQLSEYQQGVPDEKNIGLIETMILTCAEPLDSKPAVGSGSW